MISEVGGAFLNWNNWTAVDDGSVRFARLLGCSSYGDAAVSSGVLSWFQTNT